MEVLRGSVTSGIFVKDSSKKIAMANATARTTFLTQKTKRKQKNWGWLNIRTGL